MIHSIIDALLGATSLGDIGKMFPNTNHKYKNINSRLLLREVWHKIKKKYYCLYNIDITVIAQEPKITLFTEAMKTNIAFDLDCNKNIINIKATTTEKLGYIGRCEGIACESVVLLKKLKNDLI